MYKVGQFWPFIYLQAPLNQIESDFGELPTPTAARLSVMICE